MATTTENLKLVKPDYTDAADVSVINGNFDLIDKGIARCTNVRNILDNSDFRNPVNQRGQASYTGTYGIDRWRTWTTDTMSIEDDGIHVSGTLCQYIESLKPGIYTVAAKKADGTIKVFSKQSQQNFGYDAVSGIGFGFDGALYAVALPTGNYEWAVLYEGEYTAETLPPYIPKGYAAELAECRRYYQALDGYGLGHGYTADGSDIVCIVNTGVQMRIKPTFVFDGLVYCRCGSDIQVTFRDTYMGDRGNAAVVRLSFIQVSGAPPLYSPAEFFTLGNAALSADL